MAHATAMAAAVRLTVPGADWSNVGFQVRQVNGHVESTFSRSKGGTWTEPRFVVSPYLSVHGMAPGLNYAVQAFEGMKAFRTPSGQIVVFRPDRNAKRMQRSADYISAPAVPEDHFVRCVELAVAANAEFVPPHQAGGSMYVRPILFGSSAQLALSPCDEYTFVVFVMPTGVYYGQQGMDALILEQFDRTAPEGTGSAKLGGNYGPVLRWSEKAREEGYGITLHLDSETRTEIDEFSTSAFLAIRKDGDQITLVVPESKNVIASVTSESVSHIASEIFGYKVEKRPVRYSELHSFAEVMAAGTAATLVPVRSITMKSRNERFEYAGMMDDKPGPICSQLAQTLQDIQRGKTNDQFSWNLQVKATPQGFVTGSTGSADHDNQTVDNIP